MPDATAAAVGAGLLVSVLWGRSLWYLDERSAAFRRATFAAMGRSARPPGEVRSLLLSASYYGLGVLLALSFALAFRLGGASLVSFAPWHLGAALLGAVGEISLAGLLIDVGRRVTGQGPERFAELAEVPWMKGLRRLPPAMVPLVAAGGGVVEELVFRGVMLRTFTERLHVSAPAAVALAGALFCIQQLVQVRTAFQALIIGSACVAIALVGGLLVVVTGSVLPALAAHASFVVFYMVEGADRPS